MKKFLDTIGNILYFLTILFDILEFLFIPALLIIIGIFNSLPLQYYAISIGIYIALFILIDLIIRFISKALSKKYSPIIKRIVDKIFNTFEHNIKE